MARWADIWDALRTTPDEWRRKNAVPLPHCEQIGCNADEIERSAHIMTPSDANPRKLAAEAALLFEAGLDMAVFRLRAPFDPGMVQPLAEALREL